MDTRVCRTRFSWLQSVRGLCQATIRPLPLCFYCIHALEVRGGRLDSPTNALSSSNSKWPPGTRATTWHWSRWRRRHMAQTKICWWNCAHQRAFGCYLFAGMFEGRMKFRNDSKKPRWDLASDGFGLKINQRATFPPLTKARKGVRMQPVCASRRRI